jgi:hypothetical protein
MAEKMMKFSKAEKDALREALSFYLYQASHQEGIVGLRSGDKYYLEMKSALDKLVG